MPALLIGEYFAVWFAADHDRSRRGLPALRPGRTRRAVLVPSTAVGWLSTSVLAGEPRHPCPHVTHDRLELGVGALPEVHEAAVVLERLGPVAARLVQLAQPLESRGEAVGVVDEVEEEAEHPRRGDDPLV